MMIKVCACCDKQFQASRNSRVYCSRVCSNKHTGIKRAETETQKRTYNVWSCGGGIQSTAIAVLIESGRLPKPDYGIMVDCGYEKTETLSYVEQITIPRMAAVGVELKIIKTTDYTDNKLFNKQGYIVIPAYELKSNGTVVKYHTHCNNTWKARVLNKWAREQGVELMIDWHGISTDESRRERQSKNKWIKYYYPLIELKMTREQCVYEIARAGWELPPRSSCVFCPQHDNSEWAHIKRDCPEDWRKILAVEKIIQESNKNIYLHNKCKPLDEIFR